MTRKLHNESAYEYKLFKQGTINIGILDNVRQITSKIRFDILVHSRPRNKERIDQLISYYNNNWGYSVLSEIDRQIQTPAKFEARLIIDSMNNILG